jgi:hypothetical protein
LTLYFYFLLMCILFSFLFCTVMDFFFMLLCPTAVKLQSQQETSLIAVE